MRGRLAGGLLWLALSAMPTAPSAYETDQFHNRLQPLADSTEVLNQRVNEELRVIVAAWRGPRDEWRFVNAVYRRLGGRHWVDKLERWAMRSSSVDKLHTPRFRSIYHGHPFWATRVTRIFGIGPTLKVSGVLIGSDKFGHFFSQGRKFYRRWRASQDEAQAAIHSAYTERAIFGQKTTGSYSNADLVANYEGHRFYRSLFEDNINGNKPAILLWQDKGWVIQRTFDWADYVNAYWDEALDINHFDRWLYPHIKSKLVEFCGDYARAPERYAIPAEIETDLKTRYTALGLRDTSELRLAHLCPAPPAADASH